MKDGRLQSKSRSMEEPPFSCLGRSWVEEGQEATGVPLLCARDEWSALKTHMFSRGKEQKTILLLLEMVTS